MSQIKAERKICNTALALETAGLAADTATPVDSLLNCFKDGDIVSGAGSVEWFSNPQPRRPYPAQTNWLERAQTAEGQIMYNDDRAIFFPNGARSAPIHGLLSTPELGRPAFILPGRNQDLPVHVNYAIDTNSWEDLLRLAIGTKQQREEHVLMLLTRLWENRLVLQSVRRKEQVHRLSATLITLPSAGTTRLLRLVFRLADSESLPNRELFTLSFQRPDSQIVPVASHSMYSRSSWDRFSFLHATDFHITRRAEYFREKLKAAGRAGSARTMVNPNDSVRVLFNFANELHDRGDLDLIIATGDLVDYIFEAGDDRNGGGNFAYFEKLLLGQAPSKDEEGVENQELRVPIFTVLGNHDYVINPYALFFQVDVWGLENRFVRMYPAYNLSKTDARALQDGKVRSFSKESAIKMTDSSHTAPEYYFNHINSRRSYTIDLGNKHRIVMLDTGPNADVLSGVTDLVEQIFGFSNENEETFVRGTPNSSGEAFATLHELILPPAGGIFVIGMHNPPLNTSGNEYPHYFRETERTGYDEERLKSLVESFLSRQAFYSIDPGPRERGAPIYSDWPRQGTNYFKKGNLDLLDFGIVNWGAAGKLEFLRLCLRKKVDLVLCGHIHQRVEFRVRHDEKEGLLYFTDFYTENPDQYRESFDWFRKTVPVPGGGAVTIPEGDQRPIHLQVDDNAQVGERSREIREEDSDGVVTEYRMQRIPPYPNPLSAATSKAIWWEAHRPLILQTACIGPMDASQRDLGTGEKTRNKERVRFQGVRLLRVVGDTISNISYISIDDIHNGTLPASEQRKWLEPILNMMMC